MTPPDNLSDRAKQYWSKYSQVIEVTDANCEQLAILCDSIDTYWRAKEITKDNLLMPYASGQGCRDHPAVKIANQQVTNVVKLSKVLGLETAVEDDDALGDFFRCKGDE